LRNQLDGKIKKRDKNTGFIKRKPLKSCIDESFKNRRIIPIFDEECWDILAAHHDIALEQWESRQFISKRQHDYFLFDMEVNRLRREFSKACKDLNLKDKCYHSARHTRVTLWTLEFDESTVRSFTGHKSDAYENYCHLGAMLMEEESQASLKIKPRKLSKRKLKKVG
jgi:integrase